MEIKDISAQTFLPNVSSDLEEDTLSDIAASDEDLDSIGEYCFETPRLAYKADNAYKNMLQGLVLKKAIQLQMKKDEKMLITFQKHAEDNPLQFAKELSENQIKFPILQKISAPTLTNLITSNPEDLEESETEDSSAPTKHNQLWTEEEQKKLEILLLRYPPEPVETRRWEKISFALGTRTPRQVASRVQKHFIKLMRDGNPIPGRIPNKSYISNGKKRSSEATPEDVSDEEDIDPSLRQDSTYQEMLMVKKILAAKKKRLKE